jgi:uncharacterized protein
MKILLSPAKLMTTKCKNDFLEAKKPLFIDDAKKIHGLLKDKTPTELKALMQVSDKLANDNWQRYQNWEAEPTEDWNYALYAFTGDVYRGLDAMTLQENDCAYLDEHLRILSGFYGLLRPSDKIMPYRLVMGTDLFIDQHQALHLFWQAKLTQQLNNELSSKDHVINLASQEYSSAIALDQLKCPVLNIEFKEEKDGKYRTPFFAYLKQSRGAFVRHCATKKATHLDDIKAFNANNFLFNEALSGPNNLVFSRPSLK